MTESHRRYVPPPPISESLVKGPCGVAQFPDSLSTFPCVLPAGHEGSHRDEEGDEFKRGYVKQDNGSYVQEDLKSQLPPAHTVSDNSSGIVMPGMPIDPPVLIDYSHEVPYAQMDADTSAKVRESVHDYKADTGKPPLMQAVFVPFGKTLLDLASMMEDMKHKHKLEGAKDPFQEWRQLPNAKWRFADAGARHSVVNPFEVNEKDGKHLHILHGIWCLMAAYEKHLEETPP